jgi:hypothetical protein
MFFRNSFNPFAAFFPFILGIIVLDLAVKGLALWRSARNTQKVWFIVLLIVNSAGILPAIYLLFFQNRKNKR